MKTAMLMILALATPLAAEISETAYRQVFACDGSTTEFNYSFNGINGTDLEVWLYETATGLPTLVASANYTVSATNNDYSAGGTITTDSAYDSDYQLVVIRKTPLTQTTRYPQSRTIERALDRLVRMIQEVSGTVTDRCLKVGAADTAVDMNMPAAEGYVYRNGDGEYEAVDAVDAGELTIKDAWTAVLEGDANGVQRIDAKGDLGVDHVYDVRDYGAEGDGVTDDTLAFSAVSTAAADGNCVVVIPPGRYRMAWQGTDFAISDKSNDQATSQTSYCYWKDANNITIRGYGAEVFAELDVSDEGSLNLFSFYGCDNVTIEGLHLNLEVTGTAESGEGHRAVPIRFQHNGSGRGCNNITVRDCRIHVKYVGSETGAKNNAGGADNTYAKLVGVLVYGSPRPGDPNEAWMTNVKILNNWFEDCTARVCWTWYCKDVLIDGNRFDNYESDRPSVRIIQPHHNVRVTNNYFYENPAAATYNYYAVTLSSDDKDTPGSCSKAVISGNIYDLALSAAHYVSGWTDVTISDEVFRRASTVAGSPSARCTELIYDATEEPNAVGYIVDNVKIYEGGSIHSTVPRTVVTNCVIEEYNQSSPMLGAIDLSGGADGSLVRDCVIVNPESYGISVVGPNEVTIAGCDINTPATYGVYLGADSDRCTVRDNVIRGAASTGIYAINAEYPVLRDNQFEHCTSYGIRVYTGAIGASLRGNTFSDCGTNWDTLADAAFDDTFTTTVDLSNAQIKDLADTAVSLVAAPGAGKWIEFCGASLWLDYGSNVLTEPSSPDDLIIAYVNEAGAAASAAIVASGFITANADTMAFAAPVAIAGTAAANIVNKALVIANTGGDYEGNAGADTVIRVVVHYRIHSGLGL